ncbi:phosphoserine phosphatase [Desulfitobacterium hafniense]|uniref:phosphoserine phosphatase n=1 Tax=Desulfitobacterium hafniense TaxID=49338 RepID=A0A0W1JPZ7_DESHA|nr:HAD-IB family phosphatase [Desulfitobacterium hafniense]KTE93849.1 phosphoserine phosphatase [Desulfitobacterium hafniense]
MASNYLFLFDLDSTISKVEILPELAKQTGCYAQMKLVTEQTMLGELPFEHSFLQRVNILRDIEIDVVNNIISDRIPLNEQIVDFIKANRERCLIITGNLDVWIDSLMKKLGMQGRYFSSRAEVNQNKLHKVTCVIDKSIVVSQLNQVFVAIGDGDNDAGMIKTADIGIGFGGVRPIANSVLENTTYAVYSEEKLCQLLKRLL